jgi:predicted RNase H-like HicB family nuclease
MQIQAKFVRDGGYWVGWTDQVPGAITEGATVGEARARLIAAIQELWEIRGGGGADAARRGVVVEVLDI